MNEYLQEMIDVKLVRERISHRAPKSFNLFMIN
jgi:hypothetical protein